METALPPSASEPYLTLNGLALQMHRFDPPEKSARNRPAPAILFFFGGGWKGGSPTQFFPHCAYLASRGMVAFSAEYRVESQHGTTPFDALADARAAIRWVRSHAGRLGVDPDRLVAAGGSAGAHLAAACAMSRAIDHPRSDQTISARPDALILFNPVIDNGPEGYGYDRVEEHWEAFSPMHNIQIGAPPTLFLLGDRDALIPVETGREFQRRMKACGTRCDLWIYPGQKHGFFNARPEGNPWFEATLLEADRFLMSLGYLNGPAAIEALPEARGVFYPVV